MTIKLNSLIPELYVRDIGKSLIFYHRLGFHVLYQRESEKFAFLECEGSQLMLEELSDDSWMTGSAEMPLGRGVNFQIRIKDVDRVYDISMQAGLPIYKAVYEKWYRVEDHQWGHRQFLVQDPDGYLLRFFQDLGSKQA